MSKFEKCQHYDKHCSIISICCNKQYNCRICHDQIEYDEQIDASKEHKLDRFATKELVCNECGTRQIMSNKCINCNIEFGKYYCNICNLHDNEVSRDIFHCDKCGICRAGGRDNFKHCDTCGMCCLIGEHKCLVKNIKTDCPICYNSLFCHRDTVYTMKCGHALHTECINKCLENGNYKCPLCNKSMVDANQLIENAVNNIIMPDELKIDKQILCNDCNKKSVAKFHIVAMKCEHCNSYNTRTIG